MTRFLRIILTLALSFMLHACSERVELHRQLSEQEANEVIAELADKHIRASKVPAKDGVVVVVNASDIGRAVRTLDAVGLPKAARATLGDTFRNRVCKNTFLSCVLQPIAPRRGDFPIIYHDQRR